MSAEFSNAPAPKMRVKSRTAQWALKERWEKSR